MGAESPKTVKELLVYPLDSPTNKEDVVYTSGVAPTWQSRPMCYNVEEKKMESALEEICKQNTSGLNQDQNHKSNATCLSSLLMHQPQV